MKLLKFPNGATVENAMCIIPISANEKCIILLACLQLDLPVLYQPYVKNNPIIGESIIGTGEKTVNKYGTFFLEEGQFKILDDVLSYETENYEMFLEDNDYIMDLLSENEQLYEDYIKRHRNTCGD